jgi:hypothetical protein
MRVNSSKKKLRILQSLRSPWKIQKFLNRFPYDHEDFICSPVRLLLERKAQCLEGALFAAACLRLAGHKPLIVDLRAVYDDDHVIAVYREAGLWGAVSKSSFITLEYREPVYRSLRELVMSYFDFYQNLRGQLSLREYSKPLDLSRFDDRDWVCSGEDLCFIGEYLDGLKHYKLVDRKPVKVDRQLVRSSVSGRR